jgi:hypothetical protein
MAGCDGEYAGTVLFLNWVSFLVAVSSIWAVNRPMGPPSRSSGTRFGMFETCVTLSGRSEVASIMNSCGFP